MEPRAEKELIEAVHEADVAHDSEGGGTRHYVRDYLIPALEHRGLRVVRVGTDS